MVNIRQRRKISLNLVQFHAYLIKHRRVSSIDRYPFRIDAALSIHEILASSKIQKHYYKFPARGDKAVNRKKRRGKKKKWPEPRIERGTSSNVSGNPEGNPLPAYVS